MYLMFLLPFCLMDLVVSLVEVIPVLHSAIYEEVKSPLCYPIQHGIMSGLIMACSWQVM